MVVYAIAFLKQHIDYTADIEKDNSRDITGLTYM